MHIDIMRVAREVNTACNVCCKNKAHIQVRFKGYVIAICKECFESFGETRALFILDGVKKNQRYMTIEDYEASKNIFEKIENAKKGDCIIYDEGNISNKSNI